MASEERGVDQFSRRPRWPLLLGVAVIVFFASWQLAIGGGSVDQSFLSPPIQGEPKALGPPLVLQNGTLPDGRAWALSAYESDSGMCLDVSFGGSNGASSGGCGFGVKGEGGVIDAVAEEGHAVACSGDSSVVFGPVAKGTKSVALALAGQPDVAVEVSTSKQFAVDYFVTQVAGCPEIEGTTTA